MTIRTRFAPSPTGYLHIGGLRTALFSYLWAKKNKGTFILRIEDTDQKRYVAGAVDKLINTLMAVGLTPDEGLIAPNKEKGKYGPYIQSARLDIYKKNIDQLINSGDAYYCFCPPERLTLLREEQQARKEMPHYDGQCRHIDTAEAKNKIKQGESAVVRFKITAVDKITAHDLIYGDISVKPEDLDDFVILKSDGYPTYHLANVTDDHFMKISHVIRGEEWLPSLPKHILLYQALKYDLPEFVHLPLMLNPDRSKLSKRQGDVAVEDYLTKGYLPAALINYVALLGWNPGTDKEFFNLDELTKEFSLKKINKASGIFDIQKLNWFNAEHIRQIIAHGGQNYKQLASEAKTYLPKHQDKIEAILKLFGSRINRLDELSDLSAFLWELPDYPDKLLIFKKSSFEQTKLGLNQALLVLDKINQNKWVQDHLFQALDDVVKGQKLAPGDVFWPIRCAVSGLEKSPSPAEILEFLGKEESLLRIKVALKKLK